MNTLREALAALAAVREASVKEVWVSIVPMDGQRILDGTPLDEAAMALGNGGAQLIALNCAPVSVMLAALPLFSQAARRANIRFGCYPNASEQRADGSWDLQASTDGRLAECAVRWMEAGAALVGSCCGTTPETIRQISLERDHYLRGMEDADRLVASR